MHLVFCFVFFLFQLYYLKKRIKQIFSFFTDNILMYSDEVCDGVTQMLLDLYQT